MRNGVQRFAVFALGAMFPALANATGGADNTLPGSSHTDRGRENCSASECRQGGIDPIQTVPLESIPIPELPFIIAPYEVTPFFVPPSYVLPDYLPYYGAPNWES